LLTFLRFAQEGATSPAPPLRNIKKPAALIGSSFYPEKIQIRQ
jgi:hypothetical protein